MTDMDGKNVVITGGTGALGSGVVSALLDRGARCHLPVFDAAELDAFAHAEHQRVVIEEGLDLRSEVQVEEYYGGLPALYGSIHLAGGFAMSPIVETGLDSLEMMWGMNAVTAFLCSREAAKNMVEGGSGGRIVNVSAKPALVPAGGLVAYTMSKAAVASLTVSLAEELAQHGVWVNAVVPSVMDTAANREGMPDADHEAWPKVEEVASTIAFLASPENRVTRGALVPVYGKS